MSSFNENGALVEAVTRTVTSGTPLVLTHKSAPIQEFSGATAQIVRLPNATLLSVGQRFFFANRSSALLTIQYQDTSTLTTIKTLNQSDVFVLDVSTANGIWDVATSVEVSVGGLLGDAEDGDYNDGLYLDMHTLMPIGTPVDRFNEVLKQLAPQPAPVLSAISMDQTGVEARLSFGVSNPIAGYADVDVTAGNGARDINTLYENSVGSRHGAFDGTVVMTGTLASGVSALGLNYPAEAFGKGNIGLLSLEVNGVVVHVVDLTTAGAGSDFNGNGSGFTLSAATDVQFETGASLNLYKYRTGSWTVALLNQRLGMNYVRVNHFYDAASHFTGYVEWVNDTNATALSISAFSLSNFVGAGSLFLSGVDYFTSATADYAATISNAYRNVYSNGDAITYTEVGGTLVDEPIPAMAAEADNIVLSGKTFTLDAARFLNGTISTTVSVAHPLKADLVAAGSSSLTQVLLDPTVNPSTGDHEFFDAENIRLQSVAAAVSNYNVQANLALGVWDSTESLASGPAGYLDGLLYTGGGVRYPTTGANAGDFSTLAAGPAGNPDYSGLTGLRYVYVKFTNNSGVTRSNLKLNVTGTGTWTVVPGASGESLTMEIKFPTGSLTGGTGWLDAYADFATNTFTDGAGARNGADGLGRAMGVDWGLTVGTRSIAVGESVVIRITAAATWTGSISDILMTWL